MKSARLLLMAPFTLLGVMAFAQADSHKPADPPALSDAQKSFEQLKTLAGSWQGPVTTDMKMDESMGDKPLQVTLRVTSRGNALVHEMKEAGSPDDPTKNDHPVTMLYLDGDHLTLVHYCDAGNRPRMVARKSADGKTVEFDFADLSGGNGYGHMYHAVFTIIDATHHREDWTFMMPGDKPMHAHMDLQRVN
ncbi:MAG TPA: hypothetical protein VE866_12660 [Candidatus Binatia bacterium]|nr:hypothetical protein [Candidatus Binatia bacterium]